MDLLNYQYLDKMNNNIGILCYEGRDPVREMALLLLFRKATPPVGFRRPPALFVLFLGTSRVLCRARKLFRTVFPFSEFVVRH